jgi:hypothetical protein
MNAPAEEAAAHAAVSVRENRVYVGNLSYDVKYRDLEKFMTDGAWGQKWMTEMETELGRGVWTERTAFVAIAGDGGGAWLQGWVG